MLTCVARQSPRVCSYYILYYTGTAVLINARRQWRARPTVGFLRVKRAIGIRGEYDVRHNGRADDRRGRDAVESKSVAGLGSRDDGAQIMIILILQSHLSCFTICIYTMSYDVRYNTSIILLYYI